MEQKVGYKDIVKQKEYMKTVVAALINRFGDSIDAIAFSWIVYEITGNAAWSAAIFALNKLPTIFITPFAGAWVEGKRKKTIMVVTDFIRAVCVATVATGYLMGFLQPWVLAFTTVTISTVEAFRGPANMALMPKLLEEKYYEYGMSLRSTLSMVVELIGMAAASGIIAWLGSAGAIYIDMVTFLLSALIIMTVNTKEEKTKFKKYDRKEYIETFRGGLVYLKKDKKIQFIIAICVFLNAMLVPFNSLQAPLAKEVLHQGAEILSILGFFLTVGMILGSSLYPLVSQKLSSSKIVFCGGAGIGIYYLSLILCTPLYENRIFTYIFLAVASILFGIFATMLMSFVQIEFVKVVSQEYMARTGAIMDAFGSAATPVMAFIISLLASSVKIHWIFMITGVVNILAMPFFMQSEVLKKKE